MHVGVGICDLTDNYPPDPIDPPVDLYSGDDYDKTNYGPSYNLDAYPPTDYTKTDYSHDVYNPSDYNKPGYNPEYKPNYKPVVYPPPAYEKPGYQPDPKSDYPPPKPDHYPPPEYDPMYPPHNDSYVPPPGTLCKQKNICAKKGYKCCACAECTSDSFGCAETCACCPRVSTQQNFLFTARRYASTVHAVVVCLSVCLSGRLSDTPVYVLYQRLNVRTRK